MEDLERQLIKVQREMRGRELTRRFIVTEAMFEDGGDIVDLAAIVRSPLPPVTPTMFFIFRLYCFTIFCRLCMWTNQDTFLHAKQ